MHEHKGVWRPVTSLNLLWRFGEALSFLSDMLLLSSACIVGLSSETFGVKLYGSCSSDNFAGCYMGLALFSGPSRAVQGLLAFAIIILVLMCLSLHRWRSGVFACPRSIAVIASMLQDPESRKVFQRPLLDP